MPTKPSSKIASQLDAYRKKRDFAKTNEARGEPTTAAPRMELSFACRTAAALRFPPGAWGNTEELGRARRPQPDPLDKRMAVHVAPPWTMPASMALYRQSNMARAQ